VHSPFFTQTFRFRFCAVLVPITHKVLYPSDPHTWVFVMRHPTLFFYRVMFTACEATSPLMFHFSCRFATGIRPMRLHELAVFFLSFLATSLIAFTIIGPRLPLRFS